MAGGLLRNVAGQNFTFLLLNPATGLAVTGATVTTYLTIDNGSQTTAGGTVTEKGNGQYNFAPTQADTNGTNVSYLFVASSASPVNMSFFTS
jgi:hypothetical protein